jgi:hypothetical protein
MSRLALAGLLLGLLLSPKPAPASFSFQLSPNTGQFDASQGPLQVQFSVVNNFSQQLVATQVSFNWGPATSGNSFTIANLAGTWTQTSATSSPMVLMKGNDVNIPSGSNSGKVFGTFNLPLDHFTGMSNLTLDVSNIVVGYKLQGSNDVLFSPAGSVTGTYQIAAVPEPGSMAAVGLGLAAFAGARRRWKAKKAAV